MKARTRRALCHPRCPRTCEAAAALTGAAGCRPLFNRPDRGYCSPRPTYSNRAGDRALITVGCQGAQAPSLPPFQGGSETSTWRLCLTCTWGGWERRAEPGHSNLNLKPGWSRAVEKRCWKAESAGLDRGVPEQAFILRLTPGKSESVLVSESEGKFQNKHFFFLQRSYSHISYWFHSNWAGSTPALC